MTLLPRQFNSNEHENMNDFSPIPEGDYIAHIHKSSMENCKETAKDPNGKYLKLEWKIIAGKYKGRLLWTQLNLVNKNPQAVEIAQKELATICRACGVPSIQDSQQLHGVPCKIKVALIPATAQYPEKNQIKYYDKADAHIPAEQLSQSQPSAQPAQEQQEEQASQEAQPAQESGRPKPPWES